MSKRSSTDRFLCHAFFAAAAVVLVGHAAWAAPINIAPDGDPIIGAGSELSGADDGPVTNAGVVTVINDQYVAPPGPFNIRTAESVDTYAADPAYASRIYDFVGVLFDTPQNNVTRVRVQNFAANDGGWWGPPDTVAHNGVPLAETDLIAPEVQITTNGGLSWSTIASTNNYVTSNTGVVRGVGVPTSGAGPLATFDFAPQSGINGIRLIGEGGGNVDVSQGFIGVIEFEAFQDNGTVFPTLDINTTTGALALKTGAGTNLGIQGYSITSTAAIGALNPAAWLSVADNYDQGNAGPNQIDTDSQWTELTAASSRTDLSEAQIGGNGGILSANKTIPLGNAWIRNPFGEEIQAEVQLTDGRVRRIDVTYNGGAENPLIVGDFNFDGQITADDWPTVRDNFNGSLAGMSRAEAYVRGDVNGDGANNRLDFAEFKTLYDAANGSGSFAAMIAGVPEPASVVLLGLGLAVAVGASRRGKSR